MTLTHRDEPEPAEAIETAPTEPEPAGELPDPEVAEVATADYSILSTPRITEGQFASILRAHGSPAAGEAASIYGVVTSYGVDPAVFLAIFQHESSFGTAGVATRTRNPGNLVYTPSAAEFGGVKSGRWASFGTWTQGAAATANLLRIYGAGEIRPGVDTSTVRTLPFVWAPASDNNAPKAYGASLANAISTWTGARSSFTPATTSALGTATGKAARTPAAVAKAPAPALLGGSNERMILLIGALLIGLLVLAIVAGGSRRSSPPAAGSASSGGGGEA